MKHYKHPSWRQDSPFNQLTVLIMSLNGNLMNAQNGLEIGVETLQLVKPICQASAAAEQIDTLRWFLRANANAWPEENFVEEPNEY
jgi:hypothetical protein